MFTHCLHTVYTCVVQEFHAARHIADKMTDKDFVNLLEGKLYSLDDQDKYKMVRRFLCGLITLGLISEGNIW